MGNEKIAILHYGRDTDRGAVRDRYKSLFRAKLNPDGSPASFRTFRLYMLNILDEIDPDMASGDDCGAVCGRGRRSVGRVPRFIEDPSSVSRELAPTALLTDALWK